MTWIPALATLLFACEEYDRHATFIDCTSERIDSAGVRVVTSYGPFGWPTREETYVGDAPPVVAETEYSRVAGGVVESLTVIDNVGYSRFYDGHEHLESFTTNGTDPELDYECTLTHGNADRIVESACTNGVTTTYDDCQNPDTVDYPMGAESHGYTYNGCVVLNTQILGQSDTGPWSENAQFLFGREVSRVRESNGVLFSSITTWDCPASE
ncbi:MAG: hypothetical protein H6737_05265 [Alphaproteobacteria bacterium]|nr:hypothetical protein [Alphaproteobacteria bacterium]